MTLKKNSNIKDDGMTMSRTWIEVVYCLFTYTKFLSLSFIVCFWLFHFYLSSKTCEGISNSLCLIFELFFDSRKTGHCNTFLLVECLIYQYQEIPERERFVFCCYSQNKEILDLGNLSLGSLPAVGMQKIRLLTLSASLELRETGIIGCLSNGVAQAIRNYWHIWDFISHISVY